MRARLTERVEHDEEIHAYDGKDGVAIKFACRWVHCHVDSNVEHSESLSNGAGNERPLQSISLRSRPIHTLQHTLRPSCSVKAINPIAVTTILTIP